MITSEKKKTGWNSSGIVANVLNCDIQVSNFELQSRYYFHWRINTLLSFPATDQIIPLQYFYKDHFSVR